MPPRQFSLEEANGLLPRLGEKLGRLQEMKRRQDELQEKVRDYQARMTGDGHLLETEVNEARREMAKAAAEVNTLIEQVQALGCEVKDVDQGLVDFRTVMDGREVYLCWKLGEPSIGWWHELEAGYAGRQPLRGKV
ncbi:MAG TPA: DUF2203 domain-containing protein [Dehalococcoidia bacterium]|nr:DUF2203 domain-containing protein [Dehalococcoidia bacterium]